MQVSYILHLKGSKRYIDILKKEFSNKALINQYSPKHCI